jgi:hypothetical protein
MHFEIKPNDKSKAVSLHFVFLRQGIACRPPSKAAKKLFHPKPTDIYSSLVTDNNQGQLNPR